MTTRNSLNDSSHRDAPLRVTTVVRKGAPMEPPPTGVGPHTGVEEPARKPQRSHTTPASRPQLQPAREATRDEMGYIIQVVRTIMEVVDRQRAPFSSADIFAPQVQDLVKSLVKQDNPHRKLGPAVMKKVHASTVHDMSIRSGTAFEIAVTYARGPRIFAMAARVVLDPPSAQVTALRMI